MKDGLVGEAYPRLAWPNHAAAHIVGVCLIYFAAEIDLTAKEREGGRLRGVAKPMGRCSGGSETTAAVVPRLPCLDPHPAGRSLTPYY